METEVRLLGPVELWVDGQRVNLGRPQQRCVLAALALDANRTVGVDRLSEIIWSGHPPRSARNAVQVSVSRLRRLLEECGIGHAVRVVRRSTGYVLDIDPELIDLHRFSGMVAAASREPDDLRRTQLLRAALRLWRGRAFEDLSEDLRWRLSPAIDEARWSAIEDRIDADLRTGRRDADLVEELRGLVAAPPLRERIAAQFLTVLYLSGRRAEALEHYRSMQRRLRDESGVDPAPALRELHTALLHDAALPGVGGTPPAQSPPAQSVPAQSVPAQSAPTQSAPAQSAPAQSVPAQAPPSQLPPRVGAFTGRGAEVTTLDQLQRASRLDRAAGIVLLVGPAGVGKTALAVHWAHSHAAEYPDGQLYLDLRGYGEPDRQLTPGEALERLLRDIGVAGDEIPDGIDERSALLRTRLSGRRMLVLLDNARSSAQVRPLLPGSSSCLTLITSRNQLAGLVARDGARVLAVRGLPTADAVDLLVAVTGDRLRDHWSAARRLAEECDNLPLALRIAGARLAADPRPVDAFLADLADGHRGLDELSVEDGDSAVRGAFAASYRAVAPPAQHLLRMLAGHPGEDFDATAAAVLIDAPMQRARTLLRMLADEHLIEPRTGGRYGLHDLVRRLAAERAERDETETIRRGAVRRLLHWYIDTAIAADATLSPDGPETEPVQRTATPHVVEFAGIDDAFGWLDRERLNLFAAVRYAAAQRLREEVVWLARGLHTYLRRRYFLAEFIEVYELALAAAVAAGDLAGQARMASGLGVAYSYARRVDDAVAAYERAGALAARLGDRRRQATALANSGCICMEVADYRRSERYLREALVIANAEGDLRVGGVCRSNLGLLYLRLGQLDVAEPFLRDALRIADQTGYQHSRATVLEYLGDLDVARGRYAAATDWYERALAVARSIGELVVQTRVLRSIAIAHLRGGQLDSGRARLGEALRMAQRIGGPLAHEIQRQLDQIAVEAGAC